jgi:translation initiation factor 2A
MSSPPPCRILFRSKKAVELYTVSEPTNEESKNNNSPITIAKGLASIHCFSDDGTKLLLFMPSTGVKVVDLTNANTEEEALKSSFVLENSKGVQFMGLSSMGTYILTWERPIKGGTDGAAPPPNLKIWSSISGRFLHGFQMRGCKRSQWPPVRWTHDEKYAFHQVPNQLDVYNGHDFSNSNTNKSDNNDDNTEVRYFDRIRCTGMTSYTLPTQSSSSSPEGKYLISTFVGETKGKPARVSLLRYPDRCGTAENPKSGNLLVSKSFYQAEECTVNWSPQGDAALILTTTSVDTSGESYYGSTNLYLLLSDSKTKGMDGEALSVPLPGSGGGPVHDVAWMPNPNKPSAFAVISGRMPSMASLHHGTTAEATFLFGNAHRNTIVWSDHGRFLTLGGFGNLAGGMDFYDRNKMKAIPQFDPNTGADLGSRGNTASCAVGYGWSPSSRYFMVSTTSPRMNVDNGVALYKYNGLEIKDTSIISWDNQKFLPNLLLAAEFVPSKQNVYPDRPQTPPPKRSGGAESSGSTDAQGEAVKTAAPSVAYVPPVGRYVPPSARRTGGGMSLAERMRKEREGSSVGVTKVAPKGIVGGSSKGLVGMTNVEGGKSKSALKKERQRLAKKKAEEEAKAEEERKAIAEKERLAAAAEDPVKRTKKLKKLLKQIKELKGKDPSSLNEDQKKKIACEDEYTKELESLSIS